MVGAASGHLDRAGVWMSADQPGYYDNRGRWHAGVVSGYYDGQGRWIARSTNRDEPVSNMPREARARVIWLERYIRSAYGEGTLNRAQSNRAMRDLNDIRRSERFMRRNRDGELSIRDEAALNVRLDRLSGQLRIATVADGRNY